MAGLVISVPYGSLAVPPAVGRHLGLTPEDFRREHWLLADPFLLEIASKIVDRGQDQSSRALVCYGFSPLVADPLGLLAEELGQGKAAGPVFLRKDTRGNPLKPFSQKDQALVLGRSALPFIESLVETCRAKLKEEKLVALVTLRSFSTDPAVYERDRRRPRPQISLGSAEGHTPEGLATLAGTIFRALGLWPQLDWPLAAMGPPSELAKEKRLKTLSLGLRRDLYLDERTGKPKEDMEALARVLRIFLTLLEQELDRVAKIRLARAFPPKKPSSVIKDPGAKPGAPRDKPWMKSKPSPLL
ncbi:MAG: hypothetical protein LBE49_01795 [Deltaproteobacteria bacterium]|nr:hypothetical protein [Deltaproteobacteria bacterium]